MTSTSSTMHRAPGLDLVRAAAIAWVTLYHATTFGLVPDPGRWTIAFGWMGVDLFFVLSGFLIASQLLRPWAEGRRPRFGRFFVRRLLRTLPAYAVVVAIYFLVPGARERAAIEPFWQFATFTENLFIDLQTGKAFSHVWSLCVEEQFYVVFPLIVALFVGKPSSRSAIGLLVALCAIGMLARGGLWLATVAETPFDARSVPDARRYMTAIYYPTWSRLDGLIAGVAAASVRLFRPRLWQAMAVRANGVLLIGVALVVSSIALFGDQIAGFAGAVFGYPLLAVGAALIVVAASERASWIGRRPVPGATTLAAGAYSLYLVQKIAFHLVVDGTIPSFGLTGYGRLGIALATAGALGAALYGLIERPFLRLRDRLARNPRSPFVPAASAFPGRDDATATAPTFAPGPTSR